MKREADGWQRNACKPEVNKTEKNEITAYKA